jgi:cytidylate kinase
MNVGVAVSKWATTIYKRCERQCHKCDQCREFEKLIEQIDIEERSALDRQREAEKLVRAKGES